MFFNRKKILLFIVEFEFEVKDEEEEEETERKKKLSTDAQNVLMFYFLKFRECT